MDDFIADLTVALGMVRALFCASRLGRSGLCHSVRACRLGSLLPGSSRLPRRACFRAPAPVVFVGTTNCPPSRAHAGVLRPPTPAVSLLTLQACFPFPRTPRSCHGPHADPACRARGHLKSGAPARGERVAKYNRLLEIERELKAAGKDARYAGEGFRECARGQV
ncbi:hypothetical protein AcW1_002947 [Taiwanofungus camphoratus]|nr:hypothetical protein AcW1_002947 [Antrodia cinnamomea]